MKPNSPDSIRSLALLMLLTLIVALSALTADAQTISSVSPQTQRVHEYIEITGSGFGTNQGSSQVIFTNGVDTWPAGRAYVWRDNYIRIGVPVGKRDSGAIVPIAKTALTLFVQVGGVNSNARNFQVITASGGSALEFRQLTSISGDLDTTSVLGFPNMNNARTKDADIADVNGDGFADISDNNSNNDANGTHSVLRINNQDKTFTAIALEPLDSGDSGTFATEIPSGGDFFENHTSYDADFADINNDRLPDLIQTAANNFAGGSSAHRVRLLINNRGGVPGQFIEDTAARMPGAAFGTVGCPDDVDHIDMDDDGDVDFLVTMRTAPDFCDGLTSEIRIFENTGGGVFATPVVVTARANNSTHDAFWIDANNDGLYDFVAANEWGTDVQSELFLNDGTGGFTLNRSFSLSSTSGAPADFNGDGLMDFVAGRTQIRVFLAEETSACFTNPANACDYTEVQILADDGSNNPFYDLEVGDINADGWPDIVGARIGTTANNVPIWLNDGDGTFTEITGGTSSTILPGHTGDYQRLSADLLDMDQDGDLDLYVTGQDWTPTVQSGQGPNQFYENLLFGLDIVSPTAAQPAFAGSATGGRKVLVRLRADAPLAGLDGGDFIINVDGTDLDPSATVTGAQIEEEIWLLVQMPAMADGCYPLTVSLASDLAMNDTEIDALCYDEERLFDRALSIDRTTSMLYNSVTDTPDTEKLDAAKAAGNFFVNLAEDDDRIAVTSFNRNTDDGNGVTEQDEMARTDWAMTPAVVGGTDNRDLAIGVIGGLQPDGTYFPYQTTIGAGLREAWTELQDEGDPTHEWEIVLLSDGIENYAPFWSEVESGPPEVLPIKPEILAADPDVTVHTVAVGQDADVPLLIDIAESTGGQFFNLYEGTGSFGLISRLSSVYKYIDEEMRDEQRFFYREGVPELSSPGSVATTHLPKRIRMATFYVPTDFESITVGFHWNQNYAVERVRLFDPSSAEVLAAPPVDTVQTDPKHTVYRLRDPEPGWYTYIVDLGTSNPFEFYAVASGISDVMVKGRMGTRRQVSPGHFEIPIRIVAGDFDPILFANVTGEVVLPDKSRVPISLSDDGVHEDGGNADGIYSQVFAHTMPGPYTVHLETTGLSNRNEAFTRYTIMSFNFPGRPLDPDQPERPPAVDDGVKCPPCALLWAILIVFGLLLLWLLWMWYRCCYRKHVIATTHTAAVGRPDND